MATFRNNEKLFNRLQANTINCLIYVIQDGVEMSDFLEFPITQDQQFNLFLQNFSYNYNSKYSNFNCAELLKENALRCEIGVWPGQYLLKLRLLEPLAKIKN